MDERIGGSVRGRFIELTKRHERIGSEARRPPVQCRPEGRRGLSLCVANRARERALRVACPLQEGGREVSEPEGEKALGVAQERGCRFGTTFDEHVQLDEAAGDLWVPWCPFERVDRRCPRAFEVTREEVSIGLQREPRGLQRAHGTLVSDEAAALSKRELEAVRVEHEPLRSEGPRSRCPRARLRKDGRRDARPQSHDRERRPFCSERCAEHARDGLDREACGRGSEANPPGLAHDQHHVVVRQPKRHLEREHSRRRYPGRVVWDGRRAFGGPSLGDLDRERGRGLAHGGSDAFDADPRRSADDRVAQPSARVATNVVPRSGQPQSTELATSMPEAAHTAGNIERKAEAGEVYLDLVDRDWPHANRFAEAKADLARSDQEAELDPRLALGRRGGTGRLRRTLALLFPENPHEPIVARRRSLRRLCGGCWRQASSATPGQGRPRVYGSVLMGTSMLDDADGPDASPPQGEGKGAARRLVESSLALRRGLAYESRHGQLAMMDAVEGALRDDRHLFVEAGTGTGKTLAYLLPALLSGKKVVISTATIALQEQIFQKDIPLARSIVEEHGVPVQAALMKGLGNYVCKRRLAEALATSASPSLLRLADWERQSETGDRAEAGFLAEDDPTFALVSSSADTRIGAECKYYDICHVTRMRREAERASLVVVSHHLFLADLALRAGPRGEFASAIPPYDAVVFDEAQRIEGIATDFFGVRVTSSRVDSLLRDAEGALFAKASRSAKFLQDLEQMRRMVEQSRLAARAFFARLGSLVQGAGDKRPLAPSDVDVDVIASVEKLDLALSGIVALASHEESDEAEDLVARRCEDLRGDLREVLLGERTARFGGPIVSHGTEGRVAWVEARDRSVAVGASPVDLSRILRSALFDRVSSVICTSATLATAHPDGSVGFEFARARLGAPPDTEGLVVESPFEYGKNAAFFVARGLPDPQSSAYEEQATVVLMELLAITAGGAFVLCTSNRMMKAFARNLRERTSFCVLLQGEAPKKLLLSKFRARRDAVLVATSSFWEGVDVPGDALRLVVLDKIPFVVPTDPVVLARSRQIEESGGNPFVEYSVPQAAIALKQGFGRLIRTDKDRGVVALLDPRARTKAYGRRLLAGLPPAVRCESLEEVREFFGEWSRGES